jgi:hypothetical protein
MDDSLLNHYRKEWERYKTALKLVDRIFLYLNNNWIKAAAGDGQDVYDVFTVGTNSHLLYDFLAGADCMEGFCIQTHPP